MAEELIKQEGGGPLVVPDFLKEETGAQGFEAMDSSDLVVPRLCITQALTPQKKRGNPNHIEGLEEGDLFNSVTGEIYGGIDRPVQVIPLKYHKSRIKFRPIEDGGGIECRSFNGIDGGELSPTCDVCKFSQWAGRDAPECNKFMNYLALMLPQNEIIVISLKSTGLKVGSQWNMRMKMLKKPMFAGVYEVRVVDAKNKKGEFYLPNIGLKRFVTAEEFDFAKTTYNNLAARNVVIHEDGLNEEPTEAAAKGEDF